MTRGGIIYQPLALVLRDLSDWVMRAADALLIVAAIELARQLSENESMEIVTYVVRIAAAVVILTDIWRKADDWLADDTYRRGVIRFVVVPLAWALPIMVLLLIGIGGPLDMVVAEIARSLR